jgi:hypothetical protein
VRGRAGLLRAAPWVLCAITLSVLVVASWLRWTERNQGGVADEEWLYAAIGALGVAGIPVVGALIASRLPANPYGWLWCATGLAYALSEAAPFVRAADGPPWVAWVVEGWGFVSFLCLLVFVFLLFPTGRLSSPRWRWVGRGAVTVAVLAGVTALFSVDPGDPSAATPWAVHGPAAQYAFGVLIAEVSLIFGFGLMAMASLVGRYRRADPVERQQLTWFVYATVLIALYLVLDGVGLLPGGLVGALLNGASFAVLPVAVGVAVLRYRLYDIDRIVSRTVTYGLLTAVIFGVYLLVVAFLSQTGLPRGSSDAVVAAVTLAVAAVVGRARRWLQSAVDRRFDRARYDAGRAVDAFAARLRNQVDLDEISSGLRDTVAATVVPGRMSVWLRPTGRD